MAVKSTWEARELPVLEAIVRGCDDATSVTTRQLEAATGLTHDEVQRAVRALLGESPPLFETGPMRGGTYDRLARVTGHARRTVGAWPTPENLADRIVAALNDAAESADDPAEKSRLKKAADAVGGVGKGVVTGVLTHVLTQGI
jgi:hypothetical protein